MSTVLVHDAAELMSAFKSVKDGDRIDLAAGNYAGVDLTGRSFSSGITITSASANNRAVLTSYLNLDNVSGVTIKGIDVDAAKLAPVNSFARVSINSSQNVALVDVGISGHIPTASEGASPNSAPNKTGPVSGYGYDVGVKIAYSQGVTLSHLDLSDLRIGIDMHDSKNLQLDNLDLSAAREGIDIHDVTGVMIEDSAFHDFKPLAGYDHPDMIQYWGTNSNSGVHDLTIQDNMFWQDPNDPQTQTIYGSMLHAPNGNVTASNFTITNNLIVNGHTNAISLQGVDGVLVADNVLLPKGNLPDDPNGVNTPAIALFGVTGATVSHNTFLPVNNSGVTIKGNAADFHNGNITVTPDNILLSTNPSSSHFWRNYDTSGYVPTTGSTGSPGGHGRRHRRRHRRRHGRRHRWRNRRRHRWRHRREHRRRHRREHRRRNGRGTPAAEHGRRHRRRHRREHRRHRWRPHLDGNQRPGEKLHGSRCDPDRRLGQVRTRCPPAPRARCSTGKTAMTACAAGPTTVFWSAARAPTSSSSTCALIPRGTRSCSPMSTSRPAIPST